MRQAWSHFKDLQNKRIHALILCLLLCVASAFAKDVITKTDGTKLDVKVEEITETVIKYRKASNPTGPVYTIPVSSVSTVQYENGDIDTFNVSESTSDKTPLYFLGHRHWELSQKMILSQLLWRSKLWLF